MSDAKGGEEAGAFRAHESAVVGAEASVGAGTRIWHFCHVMDGARVGADCVLGQNVFVARGAIVGDRVRIQNNVSVYDGCVIEDDVFLGPSCVLTNVINPRSEVSRKDEFRTTIIGRGASIGANATIVCGAVVGRYAFVGAGAVVTGHVPPFALVYGVPARQRGWVCRCGVGLDEALVCPSCDSRYERADDPAKGLREA